jgi:hypothetical protein
MYYSPANYRIPLGADKTPEQEACSARGVLYHWDEVAGECTNMPIIDQCPNGAWDATTQKCAPVKMGEADGCVMNRGVWNPIAKTCAPGPEQLACESRPRQYWQDGRCVTISQSWWQSLSTGQRYAIIGGGVLVAGLGAFLLLGGKTKARPNRRRHRANPVDEKLIDRARIVLSMSRSEKEAAATLEQSGVAHQDAYLAVKAAKIANKTNWPRSAGGWTS